MIEDGSQTGKATAWWSQRGAARWMFLVAAVLIGVAATAVVASFRSVADDNRRAQLALGTFREQAYRLSSIEWQAIAQRRVDPELREAAVSARTQMVRALATANALDPQQPGLKTVAAHRVRYTRAVEKELSLLAAGRFEEAVEIDENMVDPAFAALDRATTEAVNINDVLAEDRIRAAETTSLSATAAGVALIGLLLFMYNRAEQEVRISEVQRETLRQSEERFRSLIRNSSNVFMILDSENRVSYVSSSARRVFGHPPEEISGAGLCELIHPDDLTDVKAALRRCARDHNEIATLEFRLQRQPGRWIFIEAAITNSLDDRSVNGIVMNCRDISWRKEMEERLRSLSLRDDLTGLYNRRGFFTLAQREVGSAARSRRELFLLFADLDGMKLINDTYGHNAGDEALHLAAKAFRRTFRDSDILARMGGDEFAVLGERTPGARSRTIVARLRRHLAECNMASDVPYEVALSVGVVLLKAGAGTKIDDVLAAADTRMYAQKRGRQESA